MSKGLNALLIGFALLASLGIAGASSNYSINIGYNATLGNYLATGSGYTLYIYTPDQAYSGVSTCTGACAQIWPAYYNSTPTFAPGLNASSFGAINRTGGMQLTYLGMPLYTYIYDSKPGQTNGQGVGGIWYVVKVSGYTPPSNSSSTGPAITNSSSAGNGANTTAVGIAGNVQRAAENSTSNQSTTGTRSSSNSTSSTSTYTYGTGSGGSSTLLYAGIAIVVIIIIIIAAFLAMRKR